MFKIIDDNNLITMDEAEKIYAEYYILFEFLEKNEDPFEMKGRVLSISDGMKDNEEYAVECNKVIETIELTGKILGKDIWV
jgi:hypothetical protein